MMLSVKKSDIIYSYADYLEWDDSERREIINGVAYNMSPAPNRKHQKVSQALSREIGIYLKGKSCEIYSAPFDVRLSLGAEDNNRIINVVQPDIVVVCDKSKLDDRGCNGVPDLVIEILSPSTAKMDLVYKLDLYEQAGVREYWVVHPTDHTIMVFKLAEDGRYGRYEMYEQSEQLIVGMFPELILDLSEIFAE